MLCFFVGATRLIGGAEREEPIDKVSLLAVYVQHSPYLTPD